MRYRFLLIQPRLQFYRVAVHLKDQPVALGGLLNVSEFSYVAQSDESRVNQITQSL